MPIKTLKIENYRSIQNLVIDLNQITVITGPNGSGKSNLYKAIYLLAQAARGEFAKTMALEGGLPSIMWAGGNIRYSSSLNRETPYLKLSVVSDDFSYELFAGPPIPVPGTMFILDPEVKEEYIWFGYTRRPSTTYLERLANSAFVNTGAMERTVYPFSLTSSESILSQLKDPHLYPELFAVAKQLQDWRFYHYFATDINSPIRYPQTSVRTTVLSNNGHDLVAALRTIIEIGEEDKLYEVIDRAFPGSQILINDPDGRSRFELKLKMPGIYRPLEACELSDGTIRYLCLAAALLSPRLPTLLILNEPEMSLHPDLIRPLAELITYAGQSSQIILTTHSLELAANISGLSGLAPVNLSLTDKGTKIS